MKLSEFKNIINGCPDDFTVLMGDDQGRTHNFKLEINTIAKGVIITKI